MPQSVLAGTNTHWFRTGKGTDPALMLHCGLGAARMWQPLMGQLGFIYQMTAVDLPGHGTSDPRDDGQDYQSQCVQVATALLKGHVVDLIGHSFGATIALRLAVEHPHLVRNLILIEPVFFAAARDEDEAAFTQYLADAQPFADAFVRGDRDAATRRFNAIWGAVSDLDQLRAEQRSYMIERIHLIAATEAALLHDNAGLLQQNRLHRFARQPTLLIEGDQSPPIIDVIHRSLAGKLANASRTTIKGAGHMSPVTHTRQVGDAIKSFLKSTHAG